MLSEKRKITDIAKFVASLLVVNGHLFMYYSGMPHVTQWVNLGAQCVSLFLFFSAYGLMCAYERKGQEYLQGFLTRRLGRILIPLATAYAVSLPVYAIFRGRIDWHNVFATLLWGGPYLKFSWYVTEIVVLYILFYFSARISRSRIMLTGILSASVFVLIVVLFVTKQPVWYINGLPCFILGLWYQHFEEKVEALFCRRKSLISIVLMFGFLVFFQWHYIRDTLPFLSAWRYEYVAMYISNIFFVLLALHIIKYVRTNSCRLEWGGRSLIVIMKFI